MSNEEVALRLLEKGVTLGCDSKLDSYFRIIDELENHSSILEKIREEKEEIRREKVHIEIAYEEEHQELTKEIERLHSIIKEVREVFKYYGDKEDIVGYSTYIITGEDLIKLLEILDKVGETDDSKRDV